MKIYLPLLMASSLVWQAAAWADEWTNLATAVTVTEGRLCAGELATDGTGTDILCDTDHPTIDSSGNVVVSGEVSATTLNATQLCDEDGANCRDLSNASSMVVSTTTMLAGWPDAIVCKYSGNNKVLLYYGYHDNSAVLYYSGDNAWYASWAISNGAWGGETYSGTLSDCESKSITTLYADGQAFNFLGNNGAQISLTEIADVSAASPADGEALIWDTSEDRWVAGSAGTTINSINDINDVSASDAVAGSILRYDGTSWTSVADLSTVLSTTTMVSGWPDAIVCNMTTPDFGTIVFSPRYMPYSSGGLYWYRNSYSGAYYDLKYNASGTFNDSPSNASDCDNKSISQLYADGQAFNFLGNNGAQISLTEIADVSASAPTEGQLLSYDASENEWVAKDVISETIILNSADDNPCVVTGGVRKLSFNPTTGRLRVCRP